MNDTQAVGICIAVILFLICFVIISTESQNQTKLLKQQVEISQKINMKLKVLTLKK